jgi:hypothetical protein
VLDYIRAIEDIEWRNAATPHVPAVSGLSSLPTPAPAPECESEEFRSDVEEESQLSQQLQDTALSQDIPLPSQGVQDDKATDYAVQGRGEVGTPEPTWVYDTAFLIGLPDSSMSALLLRRVDSIVACDGETHPFTSL